MSFLGSTFFLIFALKSQFLHLFPSQPQPAIKRIEVSSPIVPFESHGDLWFSTWADDDSVFVSWGDGLGPDYSENTPFSHHGLAKLKGKFPEVKAEVVNRFMPLSDEENNSKPTSLLFYKKRLYVAIHYPLIFPRAGFIAYSDDYGKSFKYNTGTQRVKGKNRNFICLMFINMGKSYELSPEPYVYAFGMKSEVNDRSKVYLARMPKESILDESTWSYFSGLDESHHPLWSENYKDAVPLPVLSRPGGATLFSSIYHPGIKRYLLLTANVIEGELYESPAPWGPWRLAGKWFEGKGSDWYSSYMPGIVTKDTGENSFYFTVAGRGSKGRLGDAPGDEKYRFRLGKITMILN